MMKKLQDKFLEALLNRGETTVKQLTGCVVVSRKAGGYYYLGKAGSLRYGPTRLGSATVSKKFKRSLLETTS